MRKDGKEGRNKFAEDIKNGYTENDMEIDEDDADEDISESDIVVDDDKNDDDVSDDSVATTAMSATAMAATTAMQVMIAFCGEDYFSNKSYYDKRLIKHQQYASTRYDCNNQNEQNIIYGT